MNFIAQEPLNELGKKRLRVFYMLSLVGLVMIVFGFDDNGIMIIIAGLLIPPAYYGSLRRELHRSLEYQTLSKMEFIRTPSSDILSDYHIAGRGKINTESVYFGTLEDKPLKLIHFSITTNTGEFQRTHKYIGIEFQTIKENLTFQLYDKWNYLSPSKRGHKLESDDFHKIFSVYATDAKIPFYQLDPDTMWDLMQLRKEYRFSINMETKGHKVFIYTSRVPYNALFRGALSFREILSGKAASYKLNLYEQKISEFVKKLHRVFEVLDLKSVKNIGPLDTFLSDRFALERKQK